MSEGIDFKDNRGRVAIITGMYCDVTMYGIPQLTWCGRIASYCC